MAKTGRELLDSYVPNWQGNTAIGVYNAPPSQGGYLARYGMSDMDRYQYDLAGRIFNVNSFTYGNTPEIEAGKRQNLAMRTIRGAVRGAFDLIEPLNFLKDLMDASIAGGLDPDTTIGDRLKRLNIGAYFDAYNPVAFWSGKTELAPRATSGKEIFELMGSDSKMFNNAAGFVYDVIADPLLLGGALGATGRIIGTFSKASPAAARASAALIRKGRAIDEFLSLGGQYRLLDNRSISKLTGGITPEIKNFLDSRMDEVIQSVINPNAWWNTGIQTITDRVLPRKTALELKLGKFGADVFDFSGMSKQEADDFTERVMELTLNAEANLLGISNPKDVLKSVNRELTKYRSNEKIIQGFPKVLHAAAQREAVKVVDNLGLKVIDNVDEVIPELRDVYSLLSKDTTVKANKDVLADSAERIYNLAKKHSGVNADDFIERWKQYTLNYAQIDSFIGLKKSGYELIEKTFHKNMAAMGVNSIDSQRMWEDAFSAGVSGNWEKNLNTPTNYSPKLDRPDIPNALENRIDYKEQLSRIQRDIESKKTRVSNRFQKKIGVLQSRLDKLHEGYDADVKTAYANYKSAVKEYETLARSNPIAAESFTSRLNELQSQTLQTFSKNEEDIRFAHRQNIEQLGQQLDALHSNYGGQVQEAYQVFKNAAIARENANEIRNQFRSVYRTEDVINNSPHLAGRYKEINNRVVNAEQAYSRALESLNSIRGSQGQLSQEAAIIEQNIRSLTGTLDNELSQLNITRNQALQANRASVSTAKNQEYEALISQALDRKNQAQEALNNIRNKRNVIIGQPSQRIEGEIKALENSLNLELTKLRETEAANIHKTREFINQTNRQANNVISAKETSNGLRVDPVSTFIVNRRKASGMNGADAESLPFTLGEIIGGMQEFQSLPLQTFFQGITQGHMRRAFGLFLSRGGADSYVNAFKRGKIINTQILDDTRLNKVLPKEQADLIAQYVQDVGDGGSFIAGKHEIINHLINNGVTPRDASKAIANIIADANPQIETFIRELGDVTAKYENLNKQIAGSQLLGFGRQFDAERKVIDAEYLNKLGELVNPITSIIESLSAANQRLPMQEFLSRVYEASKAKGLISTDYKQGYKKLDGKMWGAFDGLYVDPFVKQEMERAMLNPTKRASTFQHMLNVITSGYLAAPNVIFGNVIGGVTTSAMAGINPVDMMLNMTKNFKRLAKYTNNDVHDPMIDLLKEHVNLNLSSQVTQLFAKNANKFRLEKAGLEKEGFDAILSHLGNFYERQLNAPGLGNWRAKWAGLEGFQWAENWLKVSAFDTSMQDALRTMGKADMIGKWDDIAASADESVQEAVKFAAEKARIAVFDYSEMPDLLKTFQRTGVVIFPGFQYFSLGRTLNAALNKPGVLAAADRVPDAISNLALSEDERYRLFAGMDDWLKEEKGAPIHVRRDENGEQRITVIPMSQLIPTTTFADTRFLESILSGGIYKPFIEAFMAHIRGDGEAVFSGKYGQKVFDETDEFGTRISKTAEFISSNITPTLTRKLGVTPQDIRNISQNQPSSGLVGAIRRENGMKIPVDLGAKFYNQEELERGKALRGLSDEMVSLFIRAPQVYSFGGGLDAVYRQYENSKGANDRLVRELERKSDSAYSRGEMEMAQKYLDKANELEQEFLDRWTATDKLINQPQQVPPKTQQQDLPFIF